MQQLGFASGRRSSDRCINAAWLWFPTLPCAVSPDAGQTVSLQFKLECKQRSFIFRSHLHDILNQLGSPEQILDVVPYIMGNDIGESELTGVGAGGAGVDWSFDVTQQRLVEIKVLICPTIKKPAILM